MPRSIIFLIVIILFFLSNSLLISADKNDLTPVDKLTIKAISSHQIDVSWEGSSDADEHIIYVSEAPDETLDGKWSVAGRVSGNTGFYSHKLGLKPRQEIERYWYFVRTAHEGKYADSEVVSVEPKYLSAEVESEDAFMIEKDVDGDEYRTGDYGVSSSGYLFDNDGLWQSKPGTSGKYIHRDFYSNPSSLKCDSSHSFSAECKNSTCTLKGNIAASREGCYGPPSYKLTGNFPRPNYGFPFIAQPIPKVEDPDIIPLIGSPLSNCPSTSKIIAKDESKFICDSDKKNIIIYKKYWNGECRLDSQQNSEQEDKDKRDPDFYGNEEFKFTRKSLCPSYAPVCYQEAKMDAQCECDNDHGNGPGFGPYDVPKPKDILPGSLKISFDESFIRDAQNNRGFTPEGKITPFDDFYVEVSTKFCPMTGHPAQDQLYEFFGSLETTDSQGNNIVLIEKGAFYKSYENLDNVRYRWNLKGWSNQKQGIIENSFTMHKQKEKLEILIDSIVQNRPVFIRIKYRDSLVLEQNIEMDSCLHLRGRGVHRAVSMRGTSDVVLNPIRLILNAEEVIENGFNKIDPFKKYNKHYFSHYVDLQYHDDSGIRLLSFDKPAEVSSCNKRIGPSRLYYFYNFKGGKTEHESIIGNRVMYLGNADPVLAIHETGHSFCKLADEYVYGAFQRKGKGWLERNCIMRLELPGAYSYRGKLYAELFTPYQSGGYHLGCTALSTASGVDVHRPSKNSIMNDNTKEDGDKFNVISCGYCAAEITEIKTGSEWWPACMEMDTVKPRIFQKLQEREPAQRSGLYA